LNLENRPKSQVLAIRVPKWRISAVLDYRAGNALDGGNHDFRESLPWISAKPYDIETLRVIARHSEVRVMSQDANTQTMREIFRAIEERDQQKLLELLDPDFEIHWPLSLPYGGSARGLKPEGPTWSQTWEPLQPTEAERRMDARVVASNGDEVIVLWHQRGVNKKGERFDGEVLGLYRLRDGKLARAQMFYFDTAAVRKFLQAGS
jgi:ketosteroid isomerase-like protein